MFHPATLPLAARSWFVFDKPLGIDTMKEWYPSNHQRRLSMIKVSSSVVINKPVADVFAYTIDPSTATKWQGGVEAVIPEGPQDVVGSKYTEVRKFMGQEMKSTLQITLFEKNAKWGAKVLSGPVPYDVTQTFAAEGGGTRLTTEVQGEPKGFFKIAEGALQGQLQKSLDEDGERLKKLLEGG
jgi:uncharacterized protein YndB with AHSA1/START domain